MGLEEEIWNHWEREAPPKRPSQQSTREAIYVFVHVWEKDVAKLWPDCWQLAHCLDYVKQRDKEQSHREPLPASSHVSQVPWASAEWADATGEILRRRFGRRTPPFQTEQDAERYITELSTTDFFHTIRNDLASHFDISVSAATIALLTGKLPCISSANLVIKPSTIRTSEESDMNLSKVQVNFNDPNFRSYKTLPQNVRRQYRPAGGRAPTVKQAEVYTFVVLLGGPPGRKGKDKVWYEDVAAPKWNEDHPERHLTPDSLRRGYQETKRAIATDAKTPGAEGKGKKR